MIVASATPETESESVLRKASKKTDEAQGNIFKEFGSFKSFEEGKNQLRIRQALSYARLLDEVIEESKGLSDKAEEKAIAAAIKEETYGQVTKRAFYKELDFLRKLVADYAGDDGDLEPFISEISRQFSSKGLAKYCQLDRDARAGVRSLAEEQGVRWLTPALVKKLFAAWEAEFNEKVPQKIRDYIDSLKGETKTKYQLKLLDFCKAVEDMPDEYLDLAANLAEQLNPAYWDEFVAYLDDAKNLSKIGQFAQEVDLKKAKIGNNEVLASASETISSDGSLKNLADLCSGINRQQKAVGAAIAAQANVLGKVDSIYSDASHLGANCKNLLDKLEYACLAGETVRVHFDNGKISYVASLTSLKKVDNLERIETETLALQSAA